MKQIVIYKSRTGFTKKYAKWLAQSLNCECIPQEDVGGERLSDYDVIIFGSSFRAGNVEELKWYKETILPFEKTNVLFVTGAMPPSSADAVKSIEQQLGKGVSGIKEYLITRRIQCSKGIDLKCFLYIPDRDPKHV